jgi:succinoglycan biosynthesis transport protein ExoP
MADRAADVAHGDARPHTVHMDRLEGASGQRTLSDYLAVLRRRKWAAIVPILLIPVIAYVLTARQPPVYAASSGVLLSRDNLAAALAGRTSADVFTDPDRFAQTQAQLARVPEVFDRAVERAETSITATELFHSSSVAPLGNADLLNFTVSSQNPEAAVDLATAYARAFTQYRLELNTAALTSARKDLERSLAQLRAAGESGTAEYQELRRKAQELRTMELLQTQAAVVKQPSSAAQVAPTPRREAMLGLAVGLLLGLGAALLWEALDKRVRDEEEIQRGLRLPLLGRLPEPQQQDGWPRLAMLDDPANAESDAIRRLRSNLEFANLDVNAKSILVTSSVTGEGKSTTVTNLAIALARAGRKVVLVDLDLRKPSIGGLLRMSYRPGITDVAIERIELENALIPIRLDARSPIDLTRRSRSRRGAVMDEQAGGDAASPGQLWVLPAGFIPASAGELVGTQAVARTLAELESTADFVLVDAPPLLAVSDAITLSTRVDAVLVVVRLGVVDRRMLRELSRQLEASPARKLGFVLAGGDVGELYGAGYAYGRGKPEDRRSEGRAPELSPEEAPSESYQGVSTRGLRD